MARRAKTKGGGDAVEGPAVFLLPIETFEGEEVACYVAGAEAMWIAIEAGPRRGAQLLDAGYPSLAAARRAWPEAVVPAGRRRTQPRRRTGRGRDGVIFDEPWLRALWREAKRAGPARGG